MLSKESDKMTELKNICAEINGKLNDLGVTFKAPHLSAAEDLGFGTQYTAYMDNTIFVNPNCIDGYTKFYQSIIRAERGYSNEPMARRESITDMRIILAHRTVEHILSNNGITPVTLDAALGSEDVILCRAITTHICHSIAVICISSRTDPTSSETVAKTAGVENTWMLAKHFADFMVAKPGLVSFKEIMDSELSRAEISELAMIGVQLGSTNMTATINGLVSNPDSAAKTLLSIKDFTWELVNFTLAEVVYNLKVLRKLQD